uniref:Uncharacterized protein n=1 Tax=Davidia involucrata TaxID=16924 RepID=A0A5B7BAI1_DAVIN
MLSNQKLSISKGGDIRATFFSARTPLLNKVIKLPSHLLPLTFILFVCFFFFSSCLHPPSHLSFIPSIPTSHISLPLPLPFTSLFVFFWSSHHRTIASKSS